MLNGRFWFRVGWGKGIPIERRIVVQHKQADATFCDQQGCDGSSVDAKALEVIQRQPQVKSHHLFDGISMAEAGHQVLVGKFSAQGFKHLHHAILAISDGFTAWEMEQ